MIIYATRDGVGVSKVELDGITMMLVWSSDFVSEGINPYLIKDKGYPLLPWLMVPHKHIGIRHFML